MSKKFGTNTKSAEARARKDAVKQANDRDKQQKLEDEYWRDDDKQIQKKMQRKDERDQKDQEKLQKKQEIQRLLEEENAALNAAKPKTKPDLAPKKVTQAQIQQRQTDVVQNEKPKRTNLNEQEDIPIEENINRLQIDGNSARNVDDAIHVLQSSQINLEKHPEKRMKAAYDAYENENLPKLKQEHPSLRLSQLKQLLKKEWMKAPENPFNKPTKAYNQGSNLQQNSLPEQNDSDEEDN